MMIRVLFIPKTSAHQTLARRLDLVQHKSLSQHEQCLLFCNASHMQPTRTLQSDLLRSHVFPEIHAQSLRRQWATDATSEICVRSGVEWETPLRMEVAFLHSDLLFGHHCPRQAFSKLETAACREIHPQHKRS